MYSSHLFQRVASFLRMSHLSSSEKERQEFSSLSESGFIPTVWDKTVRSTLEKEFSSLSESGFIPTYNVWEPVLGSRSQVLISFREWLHSY